MNKHVHPFVFDSELPEAESLPRQFEVEIFDIVKGSRYCAITLLDGKQYGSVLTDNAYEPDGYRFHDIFHFAYVAVLGWSPVTRKFLRRKRKSLPSTDEVEDGGRAATIEEGIVALVFEYARCHRFLDGVSSLDIQLLRTIKLMTSQLEVKRCTAGEWERAILQGFEVWRSVCAEGGGRIDVNLDKRRIKFLCPPSNQNTHL